MVAENKSYIIDEHQLYLALVADSYKNKMFSLSKRFTNGKKSDSKMFDFRNFLVG